MSVAQQILYMYSMQFASGNVHYIFMSVHMPFPKCFHFFFTETVEFPSDSGFIKVNVDQSGFYRVNYDLGNWYDIIAHLQSNPQSKVLTVCIVAV